MSSVFALASMSVLATKFRNKQLFLGIIALCMFTTDPAYSMAIPDTVKHIPGYTFGVKYLPPMDTSDVAPAKPGYLFIDPQSVASTYHNDLQNNDLSEVGLYTIRLSKQTFYTIFPPERVTSEAFSFVDIASPTHLSRTAPISDILGIELQANQKRQFKTWVIFAALPLFTPQVMSPLDIDEIFSLMVIGGAMHLPILLVEALLFDPQPSLLFERGNFFKGTGNWQYQFEFVTSAYPEGLLGWPWASPRLGKSLPSVGLSLCMQSRRTNTSALISLEYATGKPPLEDELDGREPPEMNPIILSTALAYPFVQQENFSVNLELGRFGSQWLGFGEFAKIHWMIKTPLNIPIGFSHGYYFNYRNASTVHSLNIGLSHIAAPKLLNSKSRKMAISTGVQQIHVIRGIFIDKYWLASLGVSTNLNRHSSVSFQIARGYEKVSNGDDWESTIRPELIGLRYAFRGEREQLNFYGDVGVDVITLINTYEASYWDVENSDNEFQVPLTGGLAWSFTQNLKLSVGIGVNLLEVFADTEFLGAEALKLFDPKIQFEFGF